MSTVTEKQENKIRETEKNKKQKRKLLAIHI